MQWKDAWRSPRNASRSSAVTRATSVERDVISLAAHPDLIRRVANQARSCARSAWFYGDSIGFEGLLAASRLLKDPSYADFVWGFARGAWARDPNPREMDNTVPGKALVEVASARCDENLLQGLRALCAVLLERPRIAGVPISVRRAHLLAPYGGEPLGKAETALLSDPGPAIYVDCLHFEPPLLASLGALSGDRALLAESVRQATAYVGLLQDPASGLFRHFYLERTGQAYVRGWSRGQGWALLGLLDCLTFARAVGPSAALAAAAKRLTKAIVESQRANGHWGALIDDDAAGDESSAAAFFAAGLLRARRLGIVGDSVLPVAERAWAAVRSATSPEGILRGVSAAVYSSTAESHYRHVPVDQLVPWGQGPWLVAAEEVQRLAGPPADEGPATRADPV
jgi:unsaturated rhamnogalacturonyl hydrolase